VFAKDSSCWGWNNTASFFVYLAIFGLVGFIFVGMAAYIIRKERQKQKADEEK
jgi:cytoskeletal protein RodZ